MPLSILHCRAHIVPPMVWIPQQLVGTPVGYNVTLECFIEAYPISLNYWSKDDSDMIHDSNKYKWVSICIFYPSVLPASFLYGVTRCQFLIWFQIQFEFVYSLRAFWIIQMCVMFSCLRLFSISFSNACSGNHKNPCHMQNGNRYKSAVVQVNNASNHQQRSEARLRNVIQHLLPIFSVLSLFCFVI